MAEPRFTKDDLLEVFQDSFERSDGDISGLLDELKSFINAEGQSNDEFVESLKNNEGSLRSFYEDMLEKLKTGQSISNKEEQDRQKKQQESMEMTFKEMLAHQMEMNEGAFSGIVGSKKFQTDEEFSKQFISSISNTLNDQMAEMFDGKRLDDPVVLKSVEESLSNLLKNLDKDREKYNKDQESGLMGMFKRIGNSYDKFEQKFTAFFNTTAGRSISDALNILTMGQLGVVTSMLGTVGRMKDAISEVYSGISKTVDTVFQDEKAALDPAVDAAKGVGRAMDVGFLKTDEEKRTDLAEESNNYLKELLELQYEMHDFDKDQALKDDREKEQGIVAFIKELIAKVLFAVGVIVGGIAGAIVLPFKILGDVVNGLIKTLSLGTLTLGSVFGKIPVIGKIISKIVGVISSATKWFDDVAKGVKVLTGWLKFLTPLIKGLAWGVKWIAWPLQILIGAINFIKGFIGSSETTFLGKLKDGIKEAVVGFFSLPLKVIGWVWDWALGLMGIESKGTGDKLVKFLGDAVDKLFWPIVAVFESLWGSVKIFVGGFVKVISGILNFGKNLWGFVSNLLSGNLEALGPYLEGMWDAIVGMIQGVVTMLWEWIMWAPKMVGNFILSMWDGVKGNLEGTILEPVVNFIETIAGFISDVVKWVKDKIKSIPLIGDFFKDEEDKIRERNESDMAVISDSKTKLAEIEERRKKIESKEYGWWSGGEKGKEKDLLSLQREQEALLAEIAAKESDIQGRKKAISEIKSPDTLKDPQKEGMVGSFVADAKAQMSDLTGSTPSKDSVMPSQMVVTGQATPLEKDKSASKGIIDDAKAQMSDLTGRSFTHEYNREMVTKKTFVTINNNIVKPEEVPQYTRSQESPVISDSVYRVDEAKQKAAKTQADRVTKMEQTISNAIKEISVREERPIVVNTGGGDDKRQMDPPEDIESMSILWLNKSWGLG